MVSPANIRLEAPKPEHLVELRHYFLTEEDLTRWGGPGMRFPNTPVEFEQDLNLSSLRSISLLVDDKFVGFGQYYSRLERCHLGRLFIAPADRGKRLIDMLMRELLKAAYAELGHDVASIFVLSDNAPAINAYHRFGFRVEPYPEPMPLENCLYMTRSTIA